MPTQEYNKDGDGMNGYLIISGTLIVCFADREMGSLTFKGGSKVSMRYPFFGVLMVIAGLVF